MKAGTDVTDAGASPPFEEADYARALRLVRAHYLEMPGLRLTAHQVQRLAGVNALLCARVLEELVVAGLIRRAIDGRFGRSSDPAV